MIINYKRFVNELADAVKRIEGQEFAPLREQILFVKAYIFLSPPTQPACVAEQNMRLLYVLENLLRACESHDDESADYWTGQFQMLEVENGQVCEQHASYLQLECN